MSNGTNSAVTFSGHGLRIATLAMLARDHASSVAIDPGAMDSLRVSRQVIDDAVASYKQAYPNVHRDSLMYGVTSGFGEFKSVAIHPDDLIRLQRNILLSHSAGVGDTADWLDPANYFPAEVVRAALVVRLNAFLRGHSGIRPGLALVIQAMFNAGIVPLVPTKGSVGSSGDLCPLAHCFATLLGRGHFYVVGREPSAPEPGSAGARREWMLAGARVVLLPASEFWRELAAFDHPPEVRSAIEALSHLPVSNKEGLALTNGATFSTAMLALAVHDAENLAGTADIGAALAIEAMCARVRFLDEAVHEARGMAGQIDSAANIRELLDGTRLAEWAETSQDAYSLRCAPQVHGASRDAIAYAAMIAQTEINAATDNPLFFPGHEPFGVSLRRSREAQRDRVGDTHAFSAGNFHGQPIALAADFLSIAVAELADIAERRCQLLLDSHHNRNLPPNLTAMPGVDSGLMLAQYAAASVVSENKVLTHPASTDSIPTSANIEDHVAMATHAARKCRQVIENASAVLAIELVVAAQAADWRTCLLDESCRERDAAQEYAIDPNARSAAEPGPRAEPTAVQARADHRRRAFKQHAAGGPSARTAASLGIGTRAAYSAIRRALSAMHEDEPIEPMIRAVRLLVRDGTIVAAVNSALASSGRGALRAIDPLRR
ncbi:MAG: histidine ammonia-lyase [Phycisphaerales bacterium]